jgi:cytochrome c-type biogenesis protein CcmE
MNIRQRRLVLILVILVTVASAAFLTLRGLQQNVSFYRTPSQLLAETATDRHLRVGGMVEKGSIGKSADGLTISFRLSDLQQAIPVRYMGILPDLFREGQGAVVEGYWKDGSFTADTVLAKHDENYMPPDAARALKTK